jgi:hypothetical protein
MLERTLPLIGDDTTDAADDARGAPIIDLPRMGPVMKGAVLHVSYRTICAELMAPTVRLRSPPEWGSLVTIIFGEGRYPVRSQPTQAAIRCE